MGVTETTVSTPELLCPVDLPPPPPSSHVSFPSVGPAKSCGGSTAYVSSRRLLGVLASLMVTGANEPPELKKQPQVTSHN